ncbi:toxin HipA [Nonlabens spongiae]|uniref:Toxin HipA n=1 Tax=Nonlabens spongiae TaxID=331648 RepID=A0A1W6MJC6_9FLAO|nr:type II toxin-antitoxin system HipA family toxin [Nonlabens spongiae]ARN77596.1 toxin HipA [Nonlabens spongiae]
MKTAYIRLWGERIAAVSWDDDRQLANFEYTPEFVERGIEVAPLTMPLQKNRIYQFPQLRAKNTQLDTFKGLPGLLADVLPDRYGNRLIKSWLAQQGRPENDMNPVETLCFIGQRGMGALEFEPSTHRKQDLFDVSVDHLVNIAAQMLRERASFSENINHETEEAVKRILTLGTSAGGARSKAIIAYNPSTGEVKSGQTDVPAGFYHYLIKLDGVDAAQFGTSKGYGRVEIAYYLMAKDCGINMMPSQLLEENGRAHFMTQRFDREANNTKHHMQTLCAINHYDYNLVGEYSYEQLFQTMRLLRLPYPDAEEMFRRMVFNVLARNCDDHTKNFSFLLKQRGRWELSPAYDICFAYDPKSIWVSKHSLSINGKRENFIKEDMLKVAKSMNIKKPELILSSIKNVVMEWRSYAQKCQVQPDLTDHIQQHIEEIQLA